MCVDIARRKEKYLKNCRMCTCKSMRKTIHSGERSVEIPSGRYSRE
jgi:hypothetical protein